MSRSHRMSTARTCSMRRAVCGSSHESGSSSRTIPQQKRARPNRANFYQEELMSEFKRRKFLKTSAGVAAAAAVGPMIWVKDANAQWRNTPEKGAKLRVLRWSRFV
ncbi:MAG: twin-arginine translocation signal domain-containing protein, partial [Betaproteobacteria bacterium]